MRILIGALALAVTATPAIAQDRAEAEAAIRSRVTALQSSINQRDAVGYAALFAPDGDLILGDVMPPGDPASRIDGAVEPD